MSISKTTDFLVEKGARTCWMKDVFKMVFVIQLDENELNLYLCPQNMTLRYLHIISIELPFAQETNRVSDGEQGGLYYNE